MSECFVYSKNWCGAYCRLGVVSGPATRRECEAFIDRLARAGRPTHFLFVSSLEYDAAFHRYMPEEWADYCRHRRNA